MINRRSLVGSVIGFLTIMYPLTVYYGVQYIEPWIIAIILSVLLLLRLITAQADKKRNQLVVLIGIVYCGLAVWNNNLITLRFYPVLINMGLFVIFVSSLVFPPSFIERLARLQHPDLPDNVMIYTRKVTVIWSVFFLINGIIATTTAIWSSFAWWSLYNGLISYILMGLLMGIEYLVRIRTQPHVH